MDIISKIMCLLVCVKLSIAIGDERKSSRQYFVYDGVGNSIFACNRGKIINITDIELQNQPTHCPSEACHLTDLDKKYIETCTGNLTCTIPIDDMSSCIKDKGFFSVEYTCQIYAMNCDFENGSCGWDITESSWEIRQFYRGGHVLFKRNGTGTIRSSIVKGNNEQCISFILQADSGVSVILYRMYLNGTKMDTIELKRPHYVSSQREFISVDDKGDYRLVINIKLDYPNIEVSLDDFNIINIDCSRIIECSFGEDFFCGWNFNSSGLWLMVSDLKRRFLLIDTERLNVSDHAYLISPSYNGIGDMCFMLQYFMNSILASTDSLSIYIDSNNTRLKLFNTFGDRGNSLRSAFIDISANNEYTIIFDVQKGNAFRGVIGIYDISLTPGKCKGFIQHEQKCNRLDDTVKLNACPSWYQTSRTVNFNPTKNDCKSNLTANADSVCKEINNSVYCNARHISEQRTSCFPLNRLVIEYTCEDVDTDTVKNDIVVAIGIGLPLIVSVILGVTLVIYRYHRLQRFTQRQPTTNVQSVSWNSGRQGSSLQTRLNRLESMDPSSEYTDTKRETSDTEHRYMTISTSYESIIEQPNEYINNKNQCQVADNQLGDNYTTLDTTGIWRPNVYDDLASPRYTNTKDDIVNVNDEPVHGEYADCIIGEYDY